MPALGPPRRTGSPPRKQPGPDIGGPPDPAPPLAAHQAPQAAVTHIARTPALAALALHRGQLLLAESRIAARRGDSAQAHDLRERSLALVASFRTTSAVSDAARLALRLLERELSRMTRSHEP